MKKVVLAFILMAVIFSATAFARFDMDGVKVITSAYLHTANGDFELVLNRSVFNVCSEAGLNAIWKQVCECAITNGCELKTCDKIVIYFEDYWGVEKAAVLTADRKIMADEIMTNFSSYLLL